MNSGVFGVSLSLDTSTYDRYLVGSQVGRYGRMVGRYLPLARERGTYLHLALLALVNNFLQIHASNYLKDDM